MPDRTITILAATSGVLFAAYVALVGVTVYFATIRTELSLSVRDLESEVAALETEYYNAISELSVTDTALLGFVTPSEVDYVAQGGEPALTRAER